MSWDVFIFLSPTPPPSLDHLPDDFSLIPLGTADEVRDLISTSLPDVDWSDKAWGRLLGDHYVVDFNFQESGPVEGFMLHVYGGGDPLEVICKLCRETGWYALDTSTGKIIDVERPSQAGWQNFQAYRDSVIGEVKVDSGDSETEGPEEGTGSSLSLGG